MKILKHVSIIQTNFHPNVLPKFASEIDLSPVSPGVSGDVRPMASVTSPGRGRDKQLRAQSGSEP